MTMPETVGTAATPVAATLVATYETGRGLTTILTRRPTTMRRHPGQVAFPGGMIEPDDPSPFAAAVREAHEEIGLIVPPDLPFVPLSPVGTLSNATWIQPFLVRLPSSPRLRPSADEVAAILRIPLAELRLASAQRTIPHPRRTDVEVPALAWRGEIIWGATLRTLQELLDRV